MAVQHFSRSARTRTFRLSSVFAIIAAAGIAAAGSINVQARDLTAAVNSNFSTLDTWDAIDNLSRAVSSSIYEGLYRFDTNLTPQPQLAESYTVSDDGLVYTFKLRPNVKYQDGSDFTAETVKMNFDRGMNPASKLTRRTFFSFVDKVEAVDPLTVRFTLKQPTAGFITRLSNGTASMVCPSLLKKAAAAGDAAAAKKITAYEACGTGPYTLKHFEPTEVLEVVKNPNYRVAGLPKFDSLRWVPVAENSTRAMMLRTGEAQFIWPVPAEQVKALEADDKLSIQKTPSVVTRYISMNETKKPFNDVRVRKAISLAINRNALIKVAYNGLAVPSTGYLPPQIEGAVNYGAFPYDPKAARELLKEAGFPEGFHATLWSAYNDGKTLKTLQFLQQQLAQVGIHVETRALEAGQRSLIYSAQTPADSQHQLYLIGWTNSAAEPDWGLRPLLDSRSAPPVLNNDSYYKNPKVDELFDKAAAEPNPQKRVALYKELQDTVNADSPWAPLVFEMMTAGAVKPLKNFAVLPDGSFDFYQADWQE